MLKALSRLILLLPTLALADHIELRTGEKLPGQLIDFTAGFVTLQLPDSHGQAHRRVDPAHIAQLHFNDSNAPLHQRAKRRAKFLPLLSEEDAQLLPRYLQTLSQQGEPETALNLAKIWHPKNQYRKFNPLYRQILIESALASQQPAEALEHARNWLQQKPPPYLHPLPWQILAQHQLANDAPQDALTTALTPIAHATTETAPNLAPLHKLAAKAYQKLGYTEHAKAHLSPSPTSLLKIPTPLHLNP